jgi:hypothetical protein
VRARRYGYLADLKSPGVVVEAFKMATRGMPDRIHAVPEVPDLSVATLDLGAKVCVRNRFLGDWSTGFEVAEVFHHGYRIRRVSDGLSFPDVFPFEEVRLERRLHPDRGVLGSCLDREV